MINAVFLDFDKICSEPHLTFFHYTTNKYWLVVSTPLKNMLVSWDDDIPNIWKNTNDPNHKPEYDPITNYFYWLSQHVAMTCHDHHDPQHPHPGSARRA